MTRRVKINLNADDVEQHYMNWTAQLFNMCMPWACWWFAGRASAKTTQLLAERLKQAVYECPGAPFAWIADTYSNLHQNVIPSLLEGLRFLGFEQGRDFVVDIRPPEAWRRRMYNVVSSFKHTMTFSTGFSLTFFSLDRPSIGAGRSFVGIFGDEIKYWKEEQFTNILKTVRGYYAKYGDNPWYRSRTFTTDLPNPNHIGEYDWCFKIVKTMDTDRVKLLIKVSLIYNETKSSYAIVLQDIHEAEQQHGRASEELKRKLKKAEKLMDIWHRRWVKARSRVTMALVSSSFVNIDVLGTEFFEDEIKEGLEGLKTNILSIRPKLAANQKFYPTLTADNFYADGFDNAVLDKFQYGWQQDCTVLRYLDRNRPIEGGMDAGNMLSMVFGQREVGRKQYRLLKELYTISPQTERDLADKFIAYFKPQRMKVLHLYYDRAMNSYQKQRADMASKIKAAIERDASGKATGWRVILKSRGQGDIYSDVEYRFMTALLAGQLQDRLFSLLIDRHNCECTKAEMENCPTKVTKDKFNRDIIRKEKKGDKLSFDRLPKESSNLTDAVKYLLMRKEWMNVWNNPQGSTVMDPK